MPHNIANPEALTLLGALSLAVVTLWRALIGKDKQVQKLIAETIEQAGVLESIDEHLRSLTGEVRRRYSPGSSPPSGPSLK